MKRAVFVCLLLVLGCSSTRGYGPKRSLEENLDRIDGGTDEQRYHAALDLGSDWSIESKGVLRALLDSDDPMTRNAAARALWEGGEFSAAGALIFNLHRDTRTFVTTDAIYHLDVIFGTDRGYNPNLGYRYQTDKQQEWLAWWADQPFGDTQGAVEGVHPERTKERAAVRARVQAFFLMAFPTREAMHQAILDLWKELATFGKSRQPDDIALIEFAFAIFADRWPDNADIWNDQALAALNNGHWEESEKSYRHALRLKPDDPSFHNDIGVLLEGWGRLDEAEQHYRKATAIDPKSDVSWANLGDVLAALGRRKDAIEAYRRAERLAPEKWYYHRLWIERLGE